MFVLSLYPENKSYSSVRTEALSVVDMIVKRTGGEYLWWHILRQELECDILFPLNVRVQMAL